MREPAKGPLGRATAVAEGVAAAVRRRQRDREPRVLLYRRAVSYTHLTLPTTPYV